jgi:hypothetical protein
VISLRGWASPISRWSKPWLALDPPTIVLAPRLIDDLLVNLFVPVIIPRRTGCVPRRRGWSG